MDRDESQLLIFDPDSDFQCDSRGRTMKRPLLFLTYLIALTGILGTTVFADPSFIPLPREIQQGSGHYKLGTETTIVAPAVLTNEANLLASRLRTVAEIPAPIATSGTGIVLTLDSKLSPEGYELEITDKGVRITGGTNAGVYYGTQTFLQTLPAQVFGMTPAPDADWSAPALKIKDAPTTTWRGLHLDSARHFQPKEFVLKFIDAMAAQKLNRLHWHLVGSEGWRLEIKKYPKLTKVAKGTPARYPIEIPTNPTLQPKFQYGYFHGPEFYTQDEIREVVSYAARRHIVIIPEIEFPAHAMIALTAYPEISTTGKVPAARSNISPDLIGVKPESIQFIKDVLDETMALFPGKWIHFGGDEAPKGQWQNDPYTQKRIDELGLRVKDSKNSHASEDALQAWLFNEMAAYIGKQGRLPIGWEEIMHGGNIKHLAKGSVIMPWLSTENAVKSANAGYDVIHTSSQLFYLDSRQSTDPREPVALIQHVSSPEELQSFNLFPAGLTDEGKKHILGAQGQLWTELMPRTDDVEYQAYPRACAIAELTWTSPELRHDTADFKARLAANDDRLTALGLNHRRVTPPAGLKWSPQFLSSNTAWITSLSSSLASAARLEIRFDFAAGGNGLDISAVELLADGKPVAEDRHPGFTGTHPKDSTYQLQVPKDATGKLSLRISAKGSGGNDSHGDIVISPKN